MRPSAQSFAGTNSHRVAEMILSAVDRILPEQFLEKITGQSISVHQPGSFFFLGWLTALSFPPSAFSWELRETYLSD